MVSLQHVGQQFIHRVNNAVNSAITAWEVPSDSESLPGYENFQVRATPKGRGEWGYDLYKKGALGYRHVGLYNADYDRSDTVMSPGNEQMAGPLIHYAVDNVDKPNTFFPGYLFSERAIEAYEGPQPPKYEPTKERQQKAQAKIVQKFGKRNKIRA